MQVFNVTNPRSPTLLGTYTPPWPGSAFDVCVAGDYACVPEYQNGLRVVEIQRSFGRQFAARAQASSLPVVTLTAARFVRATLTCTQTLPTGTTIAYSLSPDNGAHWETVTVGVEHVFSNVGSALLWRAVFTTTDALQTPLLSGLSIAYTTRLNAPGLTSPTDGAQTKDNTPTFTWGAVTGATGYLLQIDTVASFDSPNLRNVTFYTPTTTYTPGFPLADGTWYWRVAANDSAGDWGLFDTPRSLLIDATGPTWVVTPADQVLAYGQALSYQLQATDPSGIDSWTVNDTVRFTISSSGLLTSTTTLAPGRFGVNITVYDNLNNARSASFTVTVQEQTTTTQPPPIPGFPVPAVAVGLAASLGCLVAVRRRRRKL
jgi:hypothetical protein